MQPKAHSEDTSANWCFDPDILPDAILVCQLDGRIILKNTAARDMLGDVMNGTDMIRSVFSSWHRQLVEREQADNVVDAIMASPDMKFSETLGFSNGKTYERQTRPIKNQALRLWLLRDVTVLRQADSDSAMHQSMVEADAARTAEMAEQLYMAKAELEEKQAELTRLANTDSLTGLYNRRRFMQLGNDAATDNRTGENAVWVLMLDIDYFKRVNDTYGHGAGDTAIRDFAIIIGNCIGDNGFVGRMGGEEFAAVLPDATVDDAVRVAERIRRRTADNLSRCGKQTCRFTTSIGIACTQDGEDSIEPALARADKALYSAKSFGRNRVVVMESQHI